MRDRDDARKLERGIDAAGQRHVRKSARDHEERGQEQNGAGLPAGETGWIHFSWTVMAAPSGSPSCPRTITRSPALSPVVTSTSVGVDKPVATGYLCALLSVPATITNTSSSSSTSAAAGITSAFECSSPMI